MSANIVTRFLAATLALGAGIAGASAGLAQSTVVRVSGPSAADYPVGKELESGQRIVLQQGDSVTVLDSGGTRVLKGPGRFAIGARAATDRNVLGTFISRRPSRDKVRLGVVRGDVGQDGPVPAPTVWLLELGQSGPFCLAGNERLFVWRPENRGAARLSIKAVADGTATSLAWEDGSRISAWPAELAPLNPGAAYAIALEGGQSQQELRFVRLESEPADLNALVAVLSANGCISQIERLIAAGGGEETAEAND